MRIAVVCPYALDRPGGVQTVAVELTARYVAAGHEAWLVAPGAGLAYQPPAAASLDVRLVGAAVAVPVNRSRAPFALGPGAWRRTRTAVEGADVIHVHEPFAPLTSLAALFRRRVPIVGTFHSSPTPAWGRVYDAASPLLRRVANRIARATAVSERAAHAVRRIVADPVIVPNGVDLADFRRGARRVSHRVAFVGRDDERKGLPVLLKAWRQVQSELDGGAALHVVGAEGTDGAGIRYLGRVDEDTKRRELSEASILCAPNLGGESFGIVPLEGMAAGCAVVASDLPAFRSVIGEAGVLVPRGDPEALAAAIVTLIREPGWARRYGEAAGAAAERYDWANVTAEYLAVLEAAAAQIW